MTDWLAANAWWIWPIAVIVALKWEVRRIDQRIDAVIFLLKRRGIDIHDGSSADDLY